VNILLGAGLLLVGVPAPNVSRGGSRDVKRLAGAWVKKQIWRPHVWIWGLQKANVLYWRTYLWHFWDFSAPEDLCLPCPPS